MGFNKYLVIHWNKGVKEHFMITSIDREGVIAELKNKFGNEIFIQGHNFNYTTQLMHIQAAGYPIENIIDSYSFLRSPAGFNSPFYEIVCWWGE